jgi:hypothetical protein
MLRIARVIVDAQLADVQLGIAGLAHIETSQRETQMRQGGAAIPTDQGSSHWISQHSLVARLVWLRAKVYCLNNITVPSSMIQKWRGNTRLKKTRDPDRPRVKG